MIHVNKGTVLTLTDDEAAECADSWTAVSDSVAELIEAAETLKKAARQEKREEKKNALLLCRWYIVKRQWELEAQKK